MESLIIILILCLMITVISYLSLLNKYESLKDRYNTNIKRLEFYKAQNEEFKEIFGLVNNNIKKENGGSHEV